MLNRIVKPRNSSLWYPSLSEHGIGGRYLVRAENDVAESVNTSHKARSACITLAAAKLSRTLTLLFRVPSTARENVAWGVLHSSNLALAGLREKL
jgi:hypothetical protein